MAEEDPGTRPVGESAPADGARLGAFRHILLWPLLIEGQAKGAGGVGDEDLEEVRDAWLVKLRDGSPWERREDPLAGLPELGTADDRYPEFLYFHPFVQHFLYRSQDEDREAEKKRHEVPLKVLARTDIQAVRVGLDGPVAADAETGYLQLEVARMHLYAFSTGVAVLAIEVVLPASDVGSWTLARVEDFLDRFRRVCPPYWGGNKEGGEVWAGHCPGSIVWVTERGPEAASWTDFTQAEPYRRFVREHRRPPVAPHLAWLLEPLVPATWQHAYKDPRTPRYAQIEDERIPGMTFLGFQDPQALTEQDFVRLASMDDQGASDTWPFAKPFVANRESGQNASYYDRFWDPKPAAGVKYGPSMKMNTRWMCTGYHLACVGDATDHGMFMDGDAGVLSHFRRHYFMMGLVAHFHRASLLMFVYRLAIVAEAWDHKSRFRQLAKRLQSDILRFSNLYWFTELSNQIQGQELFDLWSGKLRTRMLYDQVMEEIDTVNEVLQAHYSDIQSEASNRLALGATILAVAAIPLTLIGWLFNSWDEGTILRRWAEQGLSWLAIGGIIVGAACIVGLLVYWLLRRKKSSRD